MTEEDCRKLYQNGELNNYIWNKAHKRSRSYEDAEDYFQEAWAKIWLKVKDDSTIEDCKKIAQNAIHAAYMRKRRRHPL
jgi:DNA-directed RNA polymerase specialized sigma24 family protein